MDEQGERPIFNPQNPRAIARALVERFYSNRYCRRLMYSANQFYWWNGVYWEQAEGAALRRRAYDLLAAADMMVKEGKEWVRVPLHPKRSMIDNVIDALEAEVYSAARSPSWLVGKPQEPVDIFDAVDDLAPVPPNSPSHTDPARLLVAPNGIFDMGVGGGEMKHIAVPTPELFSLNALNYDVDPNAAPPRHWVAWLKTLWPDDPESIDLLQEWFGYCVSGRNDQEKALMMVGPPRAGKGTIAGILSDLVGPHNVAGPTLSGLGTDFGMEDLLDKRLAIVDDARLSGRSDQAVIVERILTITGNGLISVHRKMKTALPVRVATRLMFLTNELPRLSDASGALANRFLILRLVESHLHREEIGLQDRLRRELPGILVWAVKGFERLVRRTRFLTPATSSQYAQELEDLSSPTKAFLRDYCVVKVGNAAPMHDIWAAWCAWCEEEGRERPGTRNVFGRDLRAVSPIVGVSQRKNGLGQRERFYEGVALNVDGQAAVSRAKAQGKQWAKDSEEAPPPDDGSGGF